MCLLNKSHKSIDKYIKVPTPIYLKQAYLRKIYIYAFKNCKFYTKIPFASSDQL